MLRIEVENDDSVTSRDEAGAQCEKETQLPQQHVAIYKHPDVDGGWAFVVLAAMFGSFFINAGLLSSFGIYYVQFLEYFGKDRSHTSWVGSLMNAFFMVGGPVSSYILNQWGTRNSMRLGSIVMTVGMFVSAFTPSLELLFFTFGIVVACGMNLMYTSQISALNIYFDKYQYIATSLSMVGIGMGVFLVNMWTEYIIENYEWRSSFIWNAGLSLQLYVFGSLIFPLHWPQSANIENDSSVSPTHIFNRSQFLSAGNISIGSCKQVRVSTLTMSAEASYVSSFLSAADILLESTWSAFKDVCFWLISIAFFFAMLSTTSILIIYKDFVRSRGYEDQYTVILIGLGVGDICGRLSMGIAHSNRFFNSVWSYCVSLFLTGVILMCHMFIKTLLSMHLLATFFGMAYGAQNVLVAIAPIRLFGKDRLVVAFGNLLFLGGIGALFGAPIAGAIVDKTGGYDVVLGLSLFWLTLAAILMMLCAIIDKKKVHADHL